MSKQVAMNTRFIKEMVCVSVTMLISLVTFAQETTDTLIKKDLKEVVIKGKSTAKELAEQAIKTGVVNTKNAWEQAATLTELMNRTSGVRIRQSGGLGAATDISINGFQGKSIRYFKDGIPLDYLRDGFNISSIPLNNLERVEIYKGVLPVSLGADALGGAVNLISRKSQPKYLSVSYEAASFNTHRVTANGYYRAPSEKWFVGVDVFYNYADNDYQAKVKVTDPETSTQRYDRVRLFHNRFENFYAEASAGITNRKWVDELKFSLAGFTLNRQQNHPALMTDPYGAIIGKQSSIIPTLRYQKDLLQKRLHIDQFLVYNTVTVKRIDTLQGRYDWYGNFYARPGQVGESVQPSLSDIGYDNLTSRTNLTYRLNTHHTLEFNNVYTSIQQQGTDPYGAKIGDTDIPVISIPATYRKNVSGLALESQFLDRKLTTQLMAKFYYYNAKGIEAWQARTVTQDDEVTTQGSNWGLAAAAKYQLFDSFFVRASGEMANRLPDQEELFGDAIWTVPNFSLQPERSLNLNLGFRWNNEQQDAIEINGFFRRTEDLILLIPVQAPYTQFQNMRHVKGYGLELDAIKNLNEHVSFNGNLTWQDIRLFNISNSVDQWQNEARLRNTPYFFGNAGINLQWAKVFRKEDHLKAYSYYSYVREYYLETIPKSLEPGGFLGLGKSTVNTELIIPDQHLLSAGLNYTPFKKALTIGAEVKNIFNNDLYDNYRVQKAGRSFHLKLMHTIY